VEARGRRRDSGSGTSVGVATVADVIPHSEARQYVLDRCSVLPAAVLPLAEAIGRVVVSAVVAGEDVPPFANSAVDGYAVRAADLAGAADRPVELVVVAEVAAGASPDAVVGPGQAIRIMTGAPMPAGADASVMVEDTERLDGGDRVSVSTSVELGQAVRGVGEDVQAGTTLFPAGTVVTPPVAGVLASINAREIEVVRAATVAVLSTGDELIDDGSPLAPGQIRESNKTMLLGMVREAGATSVDLGVVRDDEAALEAVLRDAADRYDAIVTSGGVSMGDYDVVKAVLSRIADMRWMQIAIRPAKPFAFGLLTNTAGRQVPVFGLPGNPVSSLVSFELFARPALRRMMGHPVIDRTVVSAVSLDGLPRRPDGKTHYVRVHGSFDADGRFAVRSVGGQGSHQLAATAQANGFAVLVDGDGVPPGGSVPTIVLSIG
jgi:molybdopterin molybdotransferase